MRKITYILSVCLLFIAGSCGQNSAPAGEVTGGVTIRFAAKPHIFGVPGTRIVDEDNLAAEQTVFDLSLFMTEPDGDAITQKYVHVGFSETDDYLQVNLPEQPAQLGDRDIYVIANFADASVLESLTTVTELRETQTPFADKNDNLDPADGICMYGMLAGFDFSDPQAGTAIVPVERTCAKLRFTLTFPQNSVTSTDNSVVVAGAANYTFIGENTGLTIPADAYFNFAEPLPLTDDGEGSYTVVAYIYQASKAPVMYLYTNIGGDQQTFTATLPIPDRNYLYDIDIEVYQDITSRSSMEYRTRMVISREGAQSL